MSEYIWEEWGVKPTDDGVKYVGNFRCHRCYLRLTDKSEGINWRKQVIGYSPYVPNPIGVNPDDYNHNHDGGIVVLCPHCSARSWWHIEKRYWPETLLEEVTNWPKR